MKYEKVFVAILLLIFAASAISSMSQKGLTTDELAHIPAGYSYISAHDFRMNTEHPALMKSLAGIALIPLQPDFPEHSSWDNVEQWVWGAQFMYYSQNDADSILFYARIPIILVGLLLAFYVWRWSKELYGSKAGLLALTLFAFSPNLLAHTRLVTTDLGIAAFSFITVYYFNKALDRPSTKAWVKAGAFLGLSLAAKFTGVYLFVILPILALWKTTKEQQNDIKKYIQSLIKPAGIVLGTALGVLLLCYQIIGIPAYFVGLTQVILHSKIGHHAFLMGTHSQFGWWYYFFVTFAIKTPIALFLLLLARPFIKEKPFNKQTAMFLIPAAIFFISFIFNKINIGHRHILPIYPFLYVWISPLANMKEQWKKLLLVLTILFYIASSVMIYPHYLSYFNEFVGPENGHHYLIDSNIDWGQDLPSLKLYMDENNITNITMAYFGLDSRDYRQIEWQELKCRPQEGLIAVSVNRLVGLKQKDADCTKWLREFEPIDTIGYSIKIFNISSEQASKAQDQFCKDHCGNVCRSQGLNLATSSFNQSCRCSCF